MNPIGVEVMSAFSGDTHGLSLIWLAAILGMVLMIALISSQVVRMRTLAVRHLFLKVKIEFNNTSETGFIRALDVDRALIVTSFHPKKWDTLTLDLSSLPEFPTTENHTISATVRRIKPFGGQPRNYLVEVRFARSAKAPQSALLTSYLRHLHKI